MKKCKICGEPLEIKNNKYFCSCCGYEEEIKSEAQEKPSQNFDSQDLLNQIEKEKTELIEKCALSVCKIYNQENELMSTGTGWRGHERYIITNAHVVESLHEDNKASSRKIICEYSNKLNLYSRQKQEMKIVYFDRNEDIAILKPINGSIPMEIPTLKISSNITHQGEMVFTIGNPLHYKFTYTEGSVANPQYEQQGSNRKYPVLQTTLTLNHGNSGGPVFDIKGNVVGMSTFSELQEDDNNILEKAILGDKAMPKYKEIAGYGFCITGIAILNTINSL